MPQLRLEVFRTHHVGPIELAVGAGECVCLRGASGSGKTLLLRAIADLDPHQGEAWLDDIACSATPAPVWRRKVMLVTAESHWWADTVGAHFPHTYDADRLRELDLSPDALGWEVARCSTGERQRLALLRALALEPLALLLDEPTGNLDPDTTTTVERLLASYRTRHQAAMLWVSHDKNQVQRVADRGFVLDDGRLRGSP
jgi:ABC-type sulfate/molybdate transport systems ATPase subunit